MDDSRIWSFEESLWVASEEGYHQNVDAECVMALGTDPHIYAGEAAVKAVSHTPKWDEVTFSDQHVSRPQEGLIVIGYKVAASKGDKSFRAACTSVYRRIEHEDWTVVQHAELPLTEQD
ncbi:DUF4440 domain-containing protein [Paracoccus marinus]|uniref:DUF4440 domain-containing protein n=1 Tax=Paracoccus marinus TaxID=288426 RepID=UPI00103FC81B|nr:DUF4440 domain-containing protein [Paracoccus marinus]GLS80627.1 hypothetical protein GCM10007893_14150 [Paracoccus marinus]